MEFNSEKCSCNCIQNKNATSYLGCENYRNVDGISNTGDHSTDLGRWNVQNRWDDLHLTANSGELYANDVSVLEEYPGLDYMLAYNLYRIKYYKNDGYGQKIRKNIYNRTFPIVLGSPFPINGIGSSQYPLPIKAVFSIESSNTLLNPTSNIEYVAGSDITLKPGFAAKKGSVFTASIKEYDCKPTTYSGENWSATAYKTEDSLTQTTFLDETDTTEDILLEEDSLDLDNEIPPVGYDTNIFIQRVSGDTVYFDLNSDYTFYDDGSIVKTSNLSNKSIIEPMTISTILLYPNPTNSNAYLEYTLYAESSVRVSVQNELGQEVQQVIQSTPFIQKAGKQKLTLQTSNLTPGIYFCSIQFDNGKKTVKKFTLIH